MCSPKFGKYFYLYTFVFNLSIATVLTQKNVEDEEQPISFMHTNLHEAQLKYPTIEKQAYAIFKAIKHFRSYILKNHTKEIIFHPAVRSLFFRQEIGEKRGN